MRPPQAVERDFARSVNFGASDPRKDGAASAELRSFTLGRRSINRDGMAIALSRWGVSKRVKGAEGKVTCTWMSESRTW